MPIINALEGGAYTLTQLLTDTTSVLTSMLTWLTSIFTTALTSPIVIAFIVMAVIGVAVRFAKRLMHV